MQLEKPSAYGPSNSANRANRRRATSPKVEQSPVRFQRVSPPVSPSPARPRPSPSPARPRPGTAPAAVPSRRTAGTVQFNGGDVGTDGTQAVQQQLKTSTGAAKLPSDDSSPKITPTLRASYSEKSLTESDGFNLSRFTEAQKDLPFAKALSEIQAGRKSSCWMWYVIPSPPHMKNNREHGSCLNRKYAIRSDDEAKAYLSHESHGVDLRSNYFDIMAALRDQLKAGKSAKSVIGSFDEPKLKCSVLLFEQITRGDDKELNALLLEIADLMGISPRACGKA